MQGEFPLPPQPGRGLELPPPTTDPVKPLKQVHKTPRLLLHNM